MNDKNFIINLEKHQTKDVNDSHINGELTVIWRDWDKLLPKNPEMVYVNTVNPKEIKGPHLHKNRTTYFYCINIYHFRMFWKNIIPISPYYS